MVLISSGQRFEIYLKKNLDLVKEVTETASSASFLDFGPQI
jgi:hypothetical protein